MQLILDTEATIDIKEKMSALEDIPVKDADFFKNDINNGNKKDGDCKEKLSKHNEDEINGNGTHTEMELPSDLPIKESTEVKTQNENTDTVKNEEHIQNGDVNLENNENLSENGELHIENSKVNENNTHNEEEDSLSEKEEFSRNTESDQCDEVFYTNGNDDRNIDKIDFEVDNVKKSNSDITECEQNMEVDSELGNERIQCDLSAQRNQDDSLLEKYTVDDPAETVATVNENTETDDISKDIESNMEVDDDVVKIADFIQETCEKFTNVESPSSFTDEVETSKKIAKQTEDTPSNVITDSIQIISEKESVSTEICDSESVNGNFIKTDDNILNKPLHKESENKQDDVMNCGEPENNLGIDGRNEKEVNDKLECHLNVVEMKEEEVHDKSESNVEEEEIKEKEVNDKPESNVDVEEVKEKDANDEPESNLDVKEVKEKLVNDEPQSNSNVEEVKENLVNDKPKNKLVIEEVIQNEIIDDPERNLHVEEAKEKKVNESECNLLNVEEVKEKNIIDESDSNLDVEVKEKEVNDEPQSNLDVEVKEKEVNEEPESKLDVEEVKEKEVKLQEEIETSQEKLKEPIKIISKLSNTLDIFSDDEEMPVDDDKKEAKTNATDKQCINIEDDDDIMLIDEDITGKGSKHELSNKLDNEADMKIAETCSENATDLESKTKDSESSIANVEALPKGEESSENKAESFENLETNAPKEECKQEEVVKPISDKPLLPENFLKTYKKNLTDMTRDELEEFCILKIVESIVDRSNLSEIKSKLKAMAQNIDEYKKKAMMLTKQNRDLQVVLKSVQEEQKKRSDTPITPLKITRSVGMQVIMQEKQGMRKKTGMANANNSPNTRNLRTPNQNPRQQKSTPASPNQQIPVPRLVPANAPVPKPATPQPASVNNQAKTPSPGPNGIRPQIQKVAEKRPFSRIQSVTVDLTDDEQPTKIPNRTAPVPPVRLVSPQSLLAPQRQPFGQTLSSPRKVYIPISGPQNQNMRPGQTIMLKSMPSPRLRCPTPQVTRMPQNTVRISRVQNRHPAPLPDAMKQYQPPNWKALPPAPDLKLSKVENGIVISWKIEGYQEDSYEEIASYQLYAYQETSSPPSTALWKKIGDVKALPLPMACTLTQFMAGFKYYFAVRAVDVKSRVGPFSLPGSILLLNKM